MAASIRKAQVDQATSGGQLAYIHADGGVGGPPVARPFVGGISTGLHYQPQAGDGVVVLCEDAIVGGFPAAVVSAAPYGSTLPTLSAGETAIFGADGRVLSYVKADGSAQLYYKPSGAAITVDVQGNINIQPAAGKTTTVGGFSGSATQPPIASKASNYSMAASDGTIVATSSNLTITLPDAASATQNRMYIVKAAGVTNTTVATVSSQNIDGATTQVLSNAYTALSVISDGTQWWII